MEQQTKPDAQFLRQGVGTLAYDDTGRGPLVLCVPGIGEVRGEYRLLVPDLLAAGYRVVTMDVRGHGETSARWPDYGVDALGADIVALLRHLAAGPALVVANSMGCAAAVWAAAAAPDLFAGLVLTGPAVRDGGMPAWAGRLLYSALFAWPWGVVVWGKYYRTLYKTAHPADFEAYVARLLANLREPGRLAAMRAMIMAPKAPATVRLGQVHTPALVVMGTADPDFKDATAEAQFVAGHMGARLELIAGAGHYPHVERPAETNPPILAFLNSQVREPVTRGA